MIKKIQLKTYQNYNQTKSTNTTKHKTKSSIKKYV